MITSRRLALSLGTVLALAALVGCSSAGTGDPGSMLLSSHQDVPDADVTTDGATHPEWITGKWMHAGGREGKTEHADLFVDLTNDGNGSWSTGTSDGRGAWSFANDKLTLDGKPVDLKIGMGCRTLDIGGDVYYVDGARTACPTTPKTLTADETCLVGTFETSIGGATPTTIKYRLEADRFFYSLAESTSAAADGKWEAYGTWELLTDGSLKVTTPNRESNSTTKVEDLLGLQKNSISTSCKSKLAKYVPVACVQVGDSCTSAADCCGTALCVNYNDGRGAICGDQCKYGSDCQSGCCTTLSDGSAKVCAAANHC